MQRWEQLGLCTIVVVCGVELEVAFLNGSSGAGVEVET